MADRRKGARDEPGGDPDGSAGGAGGLPRGPSASAGGGDPDGSAGGAGGLPRGPSASAGGGDPDGSAGGAGGLPRGINRRLTDLELERWLADDLPAARQRTATEADRGRLDELRAEHAALLGSLDVGAELRAIDQRIARAAPEPRRLRWAWLFSGGALAAAAAVVLVIVLRPQPEPGPDILMKGDVALIVYAASAAGKTLDSGATVAAGDQLRFGVHVPAPGYVAVVGIDGTGATTVYYPYGGREPAAIDPRTGGVLPGAIALDEAPGDERFYAVFAERPFVIDAGLFAGLREHKLPGISAAEVVLHKKTSRF